MKLFVDLGSLQLIEGPGFRNPVSALRFKRGDAARLEVAFLRNGSTAATIGDPQQLELHFGVKPRGRYDLGYLAHTADWTMPVLGAEKPAYHCSPSFNTAELDAALQVGSAAELSEITLMGEITWREGTGEPTSTRTFIVIVENDVNRGTEGTPFTLPGPEEWLAARAASLPLVSDEDPANPAPRLIVSGGSLVPNILGVMLVKTGTDLEGWDIYESGPLNGAGFDRVVISRYQLSTGRWGLVAMLGGDEVQAWTLESNDAYPAGESDWHPVFVLDAGTARVSAAPAPAQPAHPGHLAVLPDGTASRGWVEIDGVWRELAFAHSVATVSATLASLQTTGALDALAVSGNATINGELTVATLGTFNTLRVTDDFYFEATTVIFDTGSADALKTALGLGADDVPVFDGINLNGGSIAAGSAVIYNDAVIGGQLTAPYQTLANADHVVTRGLLADEDAWSLNERLTVSNSGGGSNGGTGSANNTVGEWSGTSGSAAGGWARVAIVRNIHTFPGVSGANIRCDKDLTISAFSTHILFAGARSRLIVGDAGSGAPPLADANALTGKGWGYELRINGSAAEIRLVAFDTSFAASAWVSLGNWVTSSVLSAVMTKKGSVLALHAAASVNLAIRPPANPTVTLATQVPTSGFTATPWISAIIVNESANNPAGSNGGFRYSACMKVNSPP